MDPLLTVRAPILVCVELADGHDQRRVAGDVRFPVDLVGHLVEGVHAVALYVLLPARSPRALWIFLVNVALVLGERGVDVQAGVEDLEVGLARRTESLRCGRTVRSP